MFAARRQLGTDPDLARYLRSYPGRSAFTDLTVSERHGLIVTASGEPQRLQQRDDPLWQQAIRDGAAESAPAIDSSTRSITVRYAVALRPAEGARPVGVLEGVYPLDRVGWLLTGIDLGDSAFLQLVDKRGNLLYGPAQTELRDVPQDRALYNPDRPRSEERRVGKESRSLCDWSSDVCSSDLVRRRAPARSGCSRACTRSTASAGCSPASISATAPSCSSWTSAATCCTARPRPSYATSHRTGRSTIRTGPSGPSSKRPAAQSSSCPCRRSGGVFRRTRRITGSCSASPAPSLDRPPGRCSDPSGSAPSSSSRSPC